MIEAKQLKKLLGKNLVENASLRDYTSMRVGGVADFLFIAKTVGELITAVETSKKLKIPYLILGGGSNVIVSDFGFAGLVIINKSANIAFLADKSQILADSGVIMARLVMESASHNLTGLESLTGIPGTVGGAIYNNAGAQGVTIVNFVKSITLLSPEGKIVRYRGEWLKPGYRVTRLKQLKKEGKEIPIILSVKLQLASNKKEEILRKIQHYQESKINSQDYQKPSAGCIFKNPPGEKSAGYLLEQIGAKKMRVGGARVSAKHANFIINNKDAKARDIRQLIEQLRDKVMEKYQILLEEEVEYVGQWK